MDPLRRHVRNARDTAGVATRAAAVNEGVHASTWLRYVRREGWVQPYAGIAIAAWATDQDAATLAAVCAAHDGAASAETARWRHGLGARPRQLEVVIAHERAIRAVAPDPVPAARMAGAGEAQRANVAAQQRSREVRRWHQRCRKVRVRRSRWLRPQDVVRLDGVPTLTPVATAVSLAATDPDAVRAFLVDARQAGKLQLAEVWARLAEIGPVRGRHVLVAALEALEDRRPESAFHDEVLSVLEQHGYRPARAPIPLATPHGRSLLPDVPLPAWQVAIELDGDRFHADRAARRRDRERMSAYASTDWKPIIVDFQTWHEDRRRVFADIDAAIKAQRRHGIGRDVPLPPHLSEPDP